MPSGLLLRIIYIFTFWSCFTQCVYHLVLFFSFGIKAFQKKSKEIKTIKIVLCLIQYAFYDMIPILWQDQNFFFQIKYFVTQRSVLIQITFTSHQHKVNSSFYDWRLPFWTYLTIFSFWYFQQETSFRLSQVTENVPFLSWFNWKTF